MATFPSVLAPSDLVGPSREPFGAISGPVRVGGRVLEARPGRLVIADAFEALHLVTADDTGSLRPGALVVVVVERARTGEFLLRRVDEETPRPEPGASGEFQRLGASGRGRHLLARSRALRAVRSFFDERGFVEVETPTFVPSPGLDPHVHSLAPVERDGRVDHLITSPEFHMKRLLVGGLPRIYQIARCFRAEELGDLHEPEFGLVEWYRAFSDYEDMLTDTEELVRDVAGGVTGRDHLLVPDRASGTLRAVHLGEPFHRLTVAEAFERFAGVRDVDRLLTGDRGAYYQALVDHVEPGLAALDRPVFVTEFPTPLAALARRSPHDPDVAERFELYAGGIELSNGYGELTDAREQRARFVAERERRHRAAEPEYPLDERFLDALEEGLPRSSGNALGFDRLLALVLGVFPLRDTFAFSDAER